MITCFTVNFANRCKHSFQINIKDLCFKWITNNFVEYAKLSFSIELKKKKKNRKWSRISVLRDYKHSGFLYKVGLNFCFERM